MTSVYNDRVKAPIPEPDAMIQSGQIWVKGIRDISQTVSDTSKGQMDDIVEAWKSLATVQSLEEIKEIQTAFAKAFYEKSLTNTARIIGEFAMLAERSIAPMKILP